MFRKFIPVFILAAIALTECGKCPKEEHKQLIQPCVCESDDYFRCESSKNLNLKRVFEYISPTVDWKERKFKSLEINGSELTELEEISFFETNFEEIYIRNAHNLQRIHSNSFGATRIHLKKLVITDANQLNSSDGDHNLFDALSSMNKIQSIEISGVAITQIPDYAFRPLLGVQSDLKNLSIEGSVQSIGNYAFFDSPYYLNRIYLRNQIKFISSHAFDMRFGSFERLTIDLADNQLTANGFDSGVFLNTKRPVFVDLSRNRLTHLDEFIFKPFLKQSLMNQINVDSNLLVCDCRMKWLTKNRLNFEKQVLNAVCNDGKRFWDKTLVQVTPCAADDNMIFG